VSLFGTSKERQKSRAEEKKDVPARQERYGLPEQDLHQQEHPKKRRLQERFEEEAAAGTANPSHKTAVGG
jgi:hypothetical protein